MSELDLGWLTVTSILCMTYRLTHMRGLALSEQVNDLSYCTCLATCWVAQER